MAATVVHINAARPVVEIATPYVANRRAYIHVRNVGATMVWLGTQSISPDNAQASAEPLAPGETADYPFGELYATTIIDPSAIVGKALYSTPPDGDWGAIIAWEVFPT